MKNVTVEDDDAVLDADREHANHAGGGYCCPHCLETSEHDLFGTDEREVVECDKCHQMFVIWNEATIEQCSGKLAT